METHPESSLWLRGPGTREKLFVRLLIRILHDFPSGFWPVFLPRIPGLIRLLSALMTLDDASAPLALPLSVFVTFSPQGRLPGCNLIRTKGIGAVFSLSHDSRTRTAFSLKAGSWKRKKYSRELIPRLHFRKAALFFEFFLGWDTVPLPKRF
jgi:hypothetical protein